MNSSSPRWATDALRNHLVRFGRRSVEEARSNHRASNLRQSRRTARDATSVCPEGCQLAQLPASGRRLSRHPGHPGNRSPNPSAKGGASKIDLLTERSQAGKRFKTHPVHLLVKSTVAAILSRRRKAAFVTTPSKGGGLPRREA